MKLPLILASASARREELLRSVGIDIEILPSQVEENAVDGETAEEHVLRLARAKAEEISPKGKTKGREGKPEQIGVSPRVKGALQSAFQAASDV